jgi:hypothetical protein
MPFDLACGRRPSYCMPRITTTRTIDVGDYTIIGLVSVQLCRLAIISRATYCAAPAVASCLVGE